MLKTIELSGTGGCVSPDGTLAAYVNSDGKLVVYRTLELMEAGADSLPPLFKTGFKKPWNMQISRDNRSLFLMGEESELSSVMMLVNLETMKTAWKKPVASDLRIALPTEDNQEVVIKSAWNTLMKFKCY